MECSAGEVGGVKSKSKVWSDATENGVNDLELGSDEGDRVLLGVGVERNRPNGSRCFLPVFLASVDAVEVSSVS